jgi:HlyD family secretion protein
VRSNLAIPLVAIALLTSATAIGAFFLWPIWHNPESRSYSSNTGYPAVQRRLGKPLDADLVPVQFKAVGSKVAAPGESVPLQQTEIRPLVSGPVEQVYVSEGQWVKQGQPLLQIQRASYENAFNLARNDLSIATNKLAGLRQIAPEKIKQLQFDVSAAQENYQITLAEFDQFRYLSDQGASSTFLLNQRRAAVASSRQALQSAQQNLAIAKSTLPNEITSADLEVNAKRITLAQAQRDLSRTTIFAPTNGMISKINVYVGNVIEPKFITSLITLTRNVVFKAYIDQAQINAVKVGDKATVRLVAYPGRSFAGKVTQVNPTVVTNPPAAPGGTSRIFTYSVWIEVAGPRMSPGLQGYAEFGATSPKQVSLHVPESAVSHFSAGEGVVLVSKADGVVVPRAVTLGRVVDGQREVLSGLKNGEGVLRYPRAFQSGDKIAPKIVQP